MCRTLRPCVRCLRTPKISINRWSVGMFARSKTCFTCSPERRISSNRFTRGRVWLPTLFRMASGEESSMELGLLTIGTLAEIEKVLSTSDRFPRAYRKSWRRNLRWRFQRWAHREKRDLGFQPYYRHSANISRLQSTSRWMLAITRRSLLPKPVL